jgi:hypothetical protein
MTTPNSKHSLGEIQHLVASFVMNPLTPKDLTAECLSDGSRAEAVAQQIIKPNSKLTSLERLQIYNRQYWFRLLDSLYDDFPGLRTIVGEKRFREISVAFLTEHPSQCFTLRNLGEKLPDFLEKRPDFLGRLRRLALQMAHFEWAQIVAFDSPSWPTLDPKTIFGANFESAVLHLQPYITLLALNYPLDEFILAIKKEEAHRSEAARGDSTHVQDEGHTSLPKPARTYLAVHRHQNSLYYKRLDEGAFTLLRSLKDGIPLGPACEDASRLLSKDICNEDQKAATIQGWFAEWSSLSWFAHPPD